MASRPILRTASSRHAGHSAIVMPATPAVVPIARTNRCTVVTPSPAWPVGPGRSTNATIVAITIRLLRTGANIGTANRRCAFSRPVATAPSP